MRAIHPVKWQNGLRNDLMKSLTKASRINSVTQVIQYMYNGMTVVEACREEVMTRSSFFYMVENNPEAISEIQDVNNANKQNQLRLILLSKTEVFVKCIEAS
jgi:hypothetical protein